MIPSFEIDVYPFFCASRAYSGIARPTDSAPQWLGDPPHEPPGWYGVYDTDSTVEVIRKYAERVPK